MAIVLHLMNRAKHYKTNLLASTGSYTLLSIVSSLFCSHQVLARKRHSPFVRERIL